MINRLRAEHTDRQTDSQPDRQLDKHTDRQTDRPKQRVRPLIQRWKIELDRETGAGRLDLNANHSKLL